jgi:cytochrome c peroxidase
MSRSWRTGGAAFPGGTLLLIPALVLACSDSPTAPRESELSVIETLGELIFEDAALSLGRNQSCASCHAAEWGFKGSDAVQRGGVLEGSVPGRFGNRTPQSAAYASFAPVFQFSEAAGGHVGGNFWDGRATGLELGSPVADQARGPFLNPVEQALPDAACVAYRVSTAPYASLYMEAWDSDLAKIAFPDDSEARCGTEGTTLALMPDDRERALLAYNRIALSIAAFESSSRVNRFSSKFDAWLRGETQLTRQERMGLMLFQGPARCAVCHTITGSRPLFTDFAYHNVGTPANPDNPAQADAGFVDLGLGGATGAAPGAAGWGRVRTPTLRNVDLRPTPGAVKPFMHNGAFTSLEEVVHYYNTRDVLPRCEPGAARTSWGVVCWPAPAVEHNMNTSDMGALGLASFQEQAIVAFLRTLSDGFTR